MDDAHTTTTTVPDGQDSAIIERLLTRGCEFDFFRAVWLLERAARDCEPVGHRGPVRAEALRFRPDPSVGFPTTDVRQISRSADRETGGSLYQVDVTFMGLYGVSTPLPVHYAIDLLRDVDAQGAALKEHAQPGESVRPAGSTPTRDFLDILHHRTISLFYRAWLKYRYDVQFGVVGRDVLTDYMLYLLGCPRGTDVGVDSAPGLSPVRLIRYAGALTEHPKSAAMLEGILTDYWSGMGIQVDQCVGRWVTMSTSDLNSVSLGNCSIGHDLNIGEQVYDLNGAFTVVVGPVDWDTYQQFLPDGQAFNQTRSLVQLYCSDPLAFTIEIKLNPNEVPEWQLGTDPNAGRLGYTSWLRTDEVPATSVIFESTAGASLPEQAAHAEGMTGMAAAIATAP